MRYRMSSYILLDRNTFVISQSFYLPFFFIHWTFKVNDTSITCYHKLLVIKKAYIYQTISKLLLTTINRAIYEKPNYS